MARAGLRKKYSRRGTKKGTRRTQRGGNVGQGYTFAAPLIPGVDNGPGAAPYSSCLAEVRPGTIQAPTVNLGLPGMSGGRRRRGKGRKSYKKQRGGRYSFDLSQPLGGNPYTGGIPQVVKIPCESSGTTANRLNQHGGVGGVDSAFYQAPTAGYTNAASTWVGSTGAPVLLQTPYEARTMNPACLKTGGGKRKGLKKRQTRRRR